MSLQASRARWFRFSLRTLLFAALVLSLTIVLAFWWIGLRLDNGAAAAVSAVTVLVWLGVGELARRRFRFSLRSLLLSVTLAAVILGVLGTQIRRVREQQHAIAAITAAGGQVTYDYQNNGRRWHEGDEGNWVLTGSGLAIPNWLLQFVGNDLLVGVKSVTFNRDSQLTDEDLAALPLEAMRFETLSLSSTEITDASIERLGQLDSLTDLYLFNTGITDASLERLGQIDSLTELEIGSTAVSDQGLIHLERMTSLKRLGLYGTNVTDRGVARLQAALPNTRIQHHAMDTSAWTPEVRAAFDRLIQGGGVGMSRYGGSVEDNRHYVRFTKPRLDPKQLEILLHLPAVESVTFTGTNIRAGDLAILAEMPDLESLWIQDGSLSTAGLGHLAGLAKLESLYLYRVRIRDSDAAISADPQDADAWITQLEKLPELKSLSIVDIPLSNAGLRRLGRLTQLEQLNLGTRGARHAGAITLLRQMLPDCEIFVD